MNNNSALLPGMVEWTLAQENQNKISCSFGCGYLFFDVCGFTKLTEKVSAQGHYGVEIITNLLNQYFNLLNDKIIKYGGQILKFEGDAVLAAFPLPPDTCVAQIQLCTAEFHAALENLNIGLMQEYGSSLAYHGSIAYGPSQMIILGCPSLHLDYFVYSPVMPELYTLNEIAGRNESLVVEQTTPGGLDACTEYSTISIHDIPQFTARKLDQQFFPTEILERGQSETFTGELRNSAILFIGVNAGEFIQAGRFAEINHYYCAIQEIVYHLEGMVNKIDYTDKGMILLISFGILQTHVDDIERAIIAANQINNLASPLKAKIGLTYSNLYAGILGATERHEYGIIGGGVNIAARLMSSAEYGQIVFTKDILNSAESRFEIQFLRKTKVKGIKEELEFYLIVRELPEFVNSYIKQYNDKQQVSYLAETAQIISQIEAKKLNQVIISGGHGTGKSFLGWQILKKFYAQGSKLAIFVLDEYNKHDRLVLLRKLLCKSLECEDPLADRDALLAHLSTFLPTRDITILINSLGAASAESNVTDDSGNNKKLLLESLLKSFELMIRNYDFVLIDNIQWLDELSKLLINKRLADRAKKPQLLILTYTSDAASPAYPIPQNTKTASLELADLDSRQVYSLVRSRIPNVTHQAGDFIFQLAGGNPRFIVELCNQINSFFPDPDTLITLHNIQEIQNKGLLPYSVENLFMIKYEALSLDAKDILKKASIIGKGFTLNEIVETHKRSDLDLITEVMSELKTREIIYITDLAPELQYLFSNALMRQAVYATILLKEKTDLHNRIALFYENKYKGRSEQYSELLAYHFHLGENQSKALHYGLMAAMQNQAISNHGEAIYYYDIALQNTEDVAQLASIRLSIADSQFYLGELEAALANLDKINASDLNSPEVLTKFHYLQCRALYLAGDHEALLTYLVPISDFTGQWGEQTLIYQLDSYLQLYKMEEFNTLHSKLKHVFGANAAAEFKSKAKTPSGLLKAYLKLPETKRTAAQKRYLYLLLKLEAIATDNLMKTGQYQQALTSLQLQYEIAKGIKDDLSLRISTNAIGNIHTRMGKLDKAYKAFVEAIGIADRIGDRFGFGKVLCDLGTMHRRAGDHKKALQNYTRSLKIFEALGNLSFQGTVLHNIGEMYHWEPNYPMAEKYYRKALKIAKQRGDLFAVSIEQDALGDILYLNKRYPEALKQYTKNLKLQEEIGDTEGIAHTYGNLGNIAKDTNNYPLALQHYQKNIEMTDAIGDLDGCGRGHYNLSGLYHQMQNLPLAIEHMQEAVRIFTKSGSLHFLEQAKIRLKELVAR